MIYLLSENYYKKVRIDTEKDKAYIMDSGKETLAPQGSKIVADATMGMHTITEQEYYSK